MSPQTESKTVINSPDTLQHLKLQLPRFQEYSHVVEWLEDCAQYFSIYKVEDSKKVSIAGMHLEGCFLSL